jgi:hypothetical protein
MSFDNRKKKSWSSKSGVSEIIGNILILMITVVLFSSIMAFVQNMPMPQQLTKATFSAGITFNATGSKANLTITHAGGASMKTAQTLIIVERDSTSKGYNLTKDPSLNSALVWKTGMTWSKQLTNTSFKSVIVVTVVDLVKHTSVWTSQVTGGTGQNPPIIGQRWVDSNTATPSPDPVRDGDNFALFVTITDVDGDLETNQIWINASQISGSSSHWIPESPNGPIFIWNFSYIVSDKITADKLDGKVIIIHAADSKGHISESTFVMTVTKLPYDVIDRTKTEIFNNGPLDVSGIENLPHSSPALAAGYGTFKENLTRPGTANISRPTSTFIKDEKVFIRVASRYMSNAIGLNTLQIGDTRTPLLYTPNFTGTSTSSQPFYIVSTTGATTYECQFNTTNLPPGTYDMNISLMSSPGSDGTAKVFTSETNLTIMEKNSTITFMPNLYVYQDAACLIPWGSKLTPYNVSEGGYMMYATLNVMDTQASPSPTMDQIRITDMGGGKELYGTPQSGLMIPDAVTQKNATLYKFRVDLRYNNGNQWLTGVNSYALKVTKFADLNEGIYSLTTQVFIKASSGKADFFLGEDGINVGHANFDLKAYLTYIENNNFFTSRTMFSYQNTPSDKTTWATTAMELADLSGDGAKDLLIGQDTSNALLYFKNSINTLGGFQDGSVVPRPASDAANNIKWISSGDINGDGAIDFAYVSSANNVVIYNNTYGMTPWIYHAYGGTVVKKIKFVDMNGDGKADLITLAGGKVYVQDISKFSASFTYPVIAQIPDVSTSGGVTDFDIADMTGDGMPDIVTVGTGGDATVNGVWQNNYTANAAPDVKKLNENAAGFSPRVVAGYVQSGNVVSTKVRDKSPLTVIENATGNKIGQVDLRMKFNTLSSTYTDPTLSVVARLGSTDTEYFYAWYSVDANGNTGMYIPMFAIMNKANGNSDGGYVNYTFRLPAMAAGTSMFLRFTDSSTSLGTATDTLDIDYVAVFSNTYGKYYQSGAAYRYQVVSDTTTVYTCVRIGNIMNNADHKPDVVAAMNGAWKAFHFKVAITGFAVADATIKVTSTNALMANSAPTLFVVTDINGDGLSDVAVCRLTTVQNTISKLSYYMNLYPTYIQYAVTELGLDGGSGSITCARVTSL